MEPTDKKEDNPIWVGSSEAEVKAYYQERNQPTLLDLEIRLEEMQTMLDDLGGMVRKMDERIENFTLVVVSAAGIYVLTLIFQWFKK